MDTHLEIRLFGGLHITLDGAPLTTFMSAKVPALLAYLAVTGRAQRRDDLAALLWGELPDVDARNNLRQALANLRRSLEPYLVITRDEIALVASATRRGDVDAAKGVAGGINVMLSGSANPRSPRRESSEASPVTRDSSLDSRHDVLHRTHPLRVTDGTTLTATPVPPYFLDVAAFETQLHPDPTLPAEERAARFEAATALYTGDFLAGFFVRDAPAFEEWMLAQRARYRELALHALHTLTQLQLDLGRYDLAIRDATRLLALDEWREESHGQLMLALARTGQRSAALAQYARCRSLLGQEFGVEPSAETSALYERVKAAMTGPRHNLPATTTGFIGRERETGELRRLLTAPENRLLTILGPGGAGKTRLALETARTCEPAFLNGVWFVALAPPRPGAGEPAALAQAVADGLGCPLTGPADPEAQLLAYLRPRELLLVLDNLEEWGEATAWLCALLAQAPGVKILATSRHRLDLQAERVFPLEGLPCPPAEDADPAAFAAAQLFIRRAQRVRPDFTLAAADCPAVARICRAVQGLPLGIELAAAWAHQLTPAEIANEIEQGLDFLTTTRRDVAPRQRSLRAVFDWSWGRLTPEEQAIFARLAVFRGAFSRVAAAHVAGATLPVLAALADKSLLWRRGATYQLHEMTRRFVGEKLAGAGALAETQANHAAYYADFLTQHEEQLKGRAQQAALAAIEAEVEDLRGAWHYLVEQRDVAGIAAATGGLYHFYLLRSRFRAGQTAFRTARLALEAVVARDRRGDPSAVARLTHARVMAREARFCSALAQYEDAQRLLAASLTALTALDAPAEIAFVLGHLGGTARLQGDLDLAERHLQACLALRQQTGDPWGQAVAWLELAGVAFMREDYARAQQRCEAGLAAANGHGDLQTTAHLLTGLSLCHRELGQYQPAQACVRRSLAAYEELGDRYGILQACLTLGELNRQLGDMAAARQFCERAVLVSQEIGDRSGEADGHYRLGQIAADLGERDEALHQLRTALAQAHEIGETLTTLDVLLEIGCLPGDATQAREILRFLLAHPQLPEQRRSRAQAALARLPNGIRPAVDAPAALAQIVAQATGLRARI